MEVSITGSDPRAAAVLVNAVVEAYMVEVVNTDLEQNKQKVGKLENACAEKDQYIRTRRQELKMLALSYGTSADPEMIATKQKLLVDNLNVYRQEWAAREFEAAKLERELASEQAWLKSLDTAGAPVEPSTDLANADPVARQIAAELAVKGREQPSAEKEIKSLQEQYDKRVKELSERARERKRFAAASEISRLQALLKVTKQQRDEMAETIDRMRKTIEQFGGSTVDIEMLKSDLKQSEVILAELMSAREKAKIELQAAPRIMCLELAEVPPK
jgi:uncharacterized protein involved in exopolysaccharide biosynthesis